MTTSERTARGIVQACTHVPVTVVGTVTLREGACAPCIAAALQAAEEETMAQAAKHADCCVDREERDALRARLRVVEGALRLLYDETADYIRINHLGDVHHNVSMQKARAALTPGAGEDSINRAEQCTSN